MFKLKHYTIFLILLLAVSQFAEAKSNVSANSADDKIAFRQKANADSEEKVVIDQTEKIVKELVNDSYPQLKNARIKVKTFNSRADYFRSRFSFSRFLTFRKLHYLILVNPKINKTDAPPEGIRAIIAHELAHIDYYRRHNCFELVGLVALQSNSFTARFERGADLQAIKRGYGAGLIEYRKWLYNNIPAENVSAKKRDYFSPEEIETILKGIRQKPDLIEYFIENVPRNLAEIQLIIEGKMPSKK